MSAAKTPSQQGRASRAKGARGEREVCALLSELMGRPVRRRVRNHQGDSDLVGVEPWAIEVKTYGKSSPSMIRGWWEQACKQAHAVGGLPLLIYKTDRQPWRCVWPAEVHDDGVNEAELIVSYSDDTLTASPEFWWRLCEPLDLSGVTLI